MANTDATSPTRGSSCTHVESAPPPAGTPNSPGRVTRLINAVGGLIGGALSPSRAAPGDEIGASPFHESNADSTISGSGDDNVEQSNETCDNNIVRSAAEDYAEEGDGGLSDVEGDEVDDHFFAAANERLINTPYSKGGQTTFLFDIARRYPRA